MMVWRRVCTQGRLSKVRSPLERERLPASPLCFAAAAVLLYPDRNPHKNSRQ
jgi:hypothetical protein|eukprot:COSAG01_NODE_1226_length_11140_cov_73.834798_19_plen_52_part_00